MLDPSHIHLLLNHIPILGSLFGLLLLLIGMLIRNRTVEVTALLTLVLVAVMTIPVYLSGEESEHEIEHLAFVDDHELEEHEEHAELTLWLLLASGVASLLTLGSFKYSPKLVTTSRILALVITAAGFLSIIPLANHGGKIVHVELRGDDAGQTEHHEDHE